MEEALFLSKRKGHTVNTKEVLLLTKKNFQENASPRSVPSLTRFKNFKKRAVIEFAGNWQEYAVAYFFDTQKKLDTLLERQAVALEQQSS